MRKRNPKLPSPETLPNLYLVGFMGTGKSAIGRRIARRFGMRFLDSDKEIEQKYGMTVHEIFARHGEERFREMEREFMEGGHPPLGCVVSCGGGLACSPGMDETLKSRGVVVVLFAEPEVILKRVSSGGAKRPLLMVENPLERIRSLMDARRGAYLKCGACVSTAGSISDAEDRVALIYTDRIRRMK